MAIKGDELISSANIKALTDNEASPSVTTYPAYGDPEGDYSRYPYEEYTSTMQGGDQPHNNMPPYLAVYIWKRTA